MGRVTVLLSVLVLGVQAGCGGDVGSPDDPIAEKELTPFIQVALASGRAWGFARAVNSCWRSRSYCEEYEPDGIDCARELVACIEAGEHEFGPQLRGVDADPGSLDDPMVAETDIAPAVQMARASDAGWDYATCMNWCWRSHKHCKKNPPPDLDCDQHLGVCIEACESEFDPQFGGLDLELVIPALELQR